MKRLLLLVLVFSGCSSVPSYETVSLLDYTTQQNLSEKGLTPERIAEVNSLYNDEMLGKGRSRYDGYHRYRISDYDILVNPNDTDELYVVKDNNYILGISEGNEVRLFREGTEFPNPADTSVFWGYSDNPSIFIANEENIYFDLGLNGTDIVFDKQLWSGDKSFANYIDSLEVMPRYTISTAYINGKQCKPFIDTDACCENTDGSYTAYSFDYERGWEINTSNATLTEHCNSGDIEGERQKFLEVLYGDW